MSEHGIAKMQNQVDRLIQQFGGYWPPLNMLAAIIEEMGEVAREINAIEGIKPKKLQQSPLEMTEKIGEELADVLFSIFCMANYFKINLNEAFQKILQKYKERDANRYSSIS